MISPPIEPPGTADHSAVSVWVKRLSEAVRRYRAWRTAIYALRTGTACAFLGVFALYGFGSALLLTDHAPDNAGLLPNYGQARTLAASGEAEAWLIVWFGLAAMTWAMQPERRYPVLEARTLDTRDINALIRALKLPDAEVRAHVSKRLCPLLHLVPADGFATLSPTSVDILYGCLKIEAARMDFDLITAILAMLTKAGGEEAMPSVRLMATAAFRYNAEERICVSARYCLKILDSRRVKERERTTLLRPATNDAPADNLLRPALASETPPELLLRVSAGPKPRA